MTLTLTSIIYYPQMRDQCFFLLFFFFLGCIFLSFFPFPFFFGTRDHFCSVPIHLVSDPDGEAIPDLENERTRKEAPPVGDDGVSEEGLFLWKGRRWVIGRSDLEVLVLVNRQYHGSTRMQS